MKVKTIEVKGNEKDLLQDPKWIEEILGKGGDIPADAIPELARIIAEQSTKAFTVIDMARERFDACKSEYKRDLKELLPKSAPKDLKRFAWFLEGFKQGYDAANEEDEDDV